MDRFGELVEDEQLMHKTWKEIHDEIDRELGGRLVEILG